MKQNVFTYGTLMWLEVAGPIAGLQDLGAPATLKDYARYTVNDRDRAKVPAIIEENGSIVSGIVYQNVDNSVLVALDNFEDIERYPQYERKTVNVELEDGQVIEAQTYVANSKALKSLYGNWDAKVFEKEELEYYVNNVVPRYTSGDRSQ